MLGYYLLFVICVIPHGAEQAQDWFPTRDVCTEKCEPECEKNHDWGHCYAETRQNVEGWSCECYNRLVVISDNKTSVNFGIIDIRVQSDDIVYSASPLDKGHSFAFTNRSLTTVTFNNETVISLDKNVTQFGKDPFIDLAVNFSIPVFSMKFKVHGEFYFYTFKKWQSVLKVQLELFGTYLVDRTVELSPEKNEVGFSVSGFGMVKGGMKVGVYGNKICLRVAGSLCSWFIVVGWKCAEFNKEIHCFR